MPDFKPGDRIIMTERDDIYDLKVGDVGVVESVRPSDESGLSATFPGSSRVPAILYGTFKLFDPAETGFKFVVTAKGFERTFTDQNEAVTFARGMFTGLYHIATNYEPEAASVRVTKVYNSPAPERIEF